MKRSQILPYRSIVLPVITTNSLPGALRGTAYSATMAGTSGTYPYLWSMVASPNTGGWLSINAMTGVLSGTPGTVETETVTVTLTDARGFFAYQTYTVTVTSVPSITTTSLPNATVAVPYSFTLSATGGLPPYTWALLSDTPNTNNWLTINSTTGVISGIPPGAEIDSLSIQVTDSLSIPSAPTSLTLTVHTNTGTSTAPQAMWSGWTNSSAINFQWWHPTSQTAWGAAAFTASISGGVMTVVLTSGQQTVYGTIANGAQLFGVGIPAGTTITSFGTGTGGAGTYNINNPTLSVSSRIIMTQAAGAPDYYKVYKDGSLFCGGSVNTTGLQNPGVTASQLPIQGTGTNGRPMAWFTDNTVAAGSSHTYQISAVAAGVESSLGPSLTMTARANVGTILPTPPVDPATWIQALPNPIVPAAGGTLWLATDNGVGGTNTGWNNPGVRSGNTVTGCGVLFALNNSNINGGDVIVLTGGASYATPTGGAGGFTLPVYTGTNGFTYIISSQTPEYNAAGSLVPDSFIASNLSFKVVALTAAPVLGATSALLAANQVGLTDASGNWLLKSGFYQIIFQENDLNGKALNEERLATFTQGSATIDWHLNNGYYTSPGLTAAAISATILVAYLSGVTPFDNAASLATVSHASSANGNGFNIPAACSKVRFIGINIQPVVGGPGGNLNFSAGVAMQFTNSTQVGRAVPAESIYIDRCCWGNDPSATGAVSVPHGLAAITCNHLLVKQSYCWLGNYLNHASDSNNYVLGGQFQCWQNNYIACASETVIHGGGYVDQLQIPQDIVFRYNMSHKPASWATTAGFASVGANVKDHFELKAGMRAEIYGNLFLNSLIGAVGGYHYSPFAIECRDQIVAAGLATDQTLCCPWVRVTDVYVHDNQMYNVGTGFYASTADGNPSGFTARVRFSNNLCFFNPLNSSAERVTGPRIVGPTQDVMIDHNTFVVNNTNLNVTSVGNPWGLEFDIGGLTAGGYYVPAPATEFGWPRFQEGLTITDNIIVVGPNEPAFTNQLSPSVPLFGGYPNLKLTNNLTINDVPLVTIPPGNFINATTLANAGLANFQGDSVIPLHPSDWNVVSGTYATASTTGGPLGSIFGPALFLGNSMQGITLQSGALGIKFVGTDQKYGNVLPRYPASPWGGTANFTDSIQQIFNTGNSGPCTAGQGVGCDITEAIGTDLTVPSGVSTSVLITTLVNAYNGVPQDAWQIQPDTSVPQGMLYTSRWVWLQADMTSRGNFTQELAEFKTPDGNSTRLGPERFQMNILQQSFAFGSTVPSFNFSHNTAFGYPAGGFYNYMNSYVSPNTGPSLGYTAGITRGNVPVPLGRWFKVELAFNRSDSSGQGWMWAAITDPGSSDPALQAGAQIFAARGAFTFTDPGPNQTWTNGLNPGPAFGGSSPATPVMNRLFLHNLSYGPIARSAASPYVIKMTDMQVYAGWPASATAHPANYT